MPSTEPYGDTKKKGVLFGCDNWGTILHEKASYKNARGIEMKPYLIIPHPHMMAEYLHLQKPGALTYKNIALWVEYPTYWIDDSNPSRTNAVVRVDCGFDGRETSQTKRNANLKKENMHLQEELDHAESYNVVLIEKNAQLVKEVIQQMKDISEMNKIIGGDRRDASEEDEDDEREN